MANVLIQVRTCWTLQDDDLQPPAAATTSICFRDAIEIHRAAEKGGWVGELVIPWSAFNNQSAFTTVEAETVPSACFY